MRAKELLKLLHPMKKGLAKAGPDPLKKGNYVISPITDQGVIGKVVHVGQGALSMREWVQDPEGYLTPTQTHSAHVFDRVQPLVVDETRSHKLLVVGPSKGAPPQLKHFKVMGKGLNKCEAKHIYKALRKKSKSQRLTRQEL
jgi:hypothetical protein